MQKAEAVCRGVDDDAGASDREWVRAHMALTRLARERAAADAEEGRWLLLAWRSGAHVFLGFGSFSEYVERLLGYSPRATREKLRVAEALEALPLSASALQQGKLTWCAARELTRVATADTEAAWLVAADGKTTRDLERCVAGKRLGELPARATEPPSPRRHILRLEVAPETLATFREAAQRLRRAAGGALDDDALLLTMARQVLGAPPEERSSYRIAYEVCPACGQGAQLAGGELVPVGQEVLAMAACDAEQLPVPKGCPANENHRAATRGAEPASAFASSPAAPTNAGSATLISHETPVSPMTPASATSPASTTHVGRARQAVPPATRRAVFARDRHLCQVPGCTNTHFVDVHHIVPRSEGGANTLENLITICTAHHRATHRGELIIERTPTALLYRHADGTPYGQPVSAACVRDHTRVFSALRHLGFREGEVRAVLAELRDDVSQCDATTEQLLREALRRIRPAPSRCRRGGNR